MRASHGYVVQYLAGTDHPVSRTGSELARRIGIEVTPSEDRRAKQVSLS
jgi:hypothetical protein